ADGRQLIEQEQRQEEDRGDGDYTTQNPVGGAEDDVRQRVEVLLCVSRDMEPLVETVDLAVVLSLGDRLRYRCRELVDLCDERCDECDQDGDEAEDEPNEH